MRMDAAAIGANVPLTIRAEASLIVLDKSLECAEREGCTFRR